MMVPPLCAWLVLSVLLALVSVVAEMAAPSAAADVAANCTCAAPSALVAPPTSTSECPILLLLPFTSRGRPNNELSPDTAFAHMAAALLAFDHFNARDPAVVPDLPALVDGDADGPVCNVVLPSRLPNGQSAAADVGNHVGPAVRAVLDALEGGAGPCAIVGPYYNKAAAAAATITAARDIPLLSYAAADARGLGRSHVLPLTAKVVADELDRARAVADYLLDGRGRDYIHLLYMDDLTAAAEAMAEAVAERSEEVRYAAIKVGPPNLRGSLEDALSRVRDSTWKTIVVALSRSRQWDVLVAAADALGMLDPSLNLVWVGYDAGGLDLRVLAADTASRPRARLLNGMAVVRVLDGFQYRGEDEDRFLRSWRGMAGNESFVERLNAMHPIQLSEAGGGGGGNGGSGNDNGGNDGNGNRGNGNSSSSGNISSNGNSHTVSSNGNIFGDNAGEGNAVSKGSESRGDNGGRGRKLQGGNKGGGGGGGAPKAPAGYYSAASDYFATHDPAPYSAFVYDAIVALGVGQCRAQAKRRAGLPEVAPPPWNPKDGPPTYPYTGTGNLFYNETVAAAFRGATGDEVVLHDRTFFSREGRTMAYGVYNLRVAWGTGGPSPAPSAAPVVYVLEHVLTSVREPRAANWTPMVGADGAPRSFRHADGTAAEPAPLHEIPQDTVQSNAGMIAAVMLGSVLGALLVGAALYSAWKRYRTYRRISQEHEKRMDVTIEEAGRALRELDFPLHLLRGDEFAAEGALVCHEVLRDRHKHTVIDHLGDVDAFIAAGNQVVFFSHQWTSYNAPDPTTMQYRSMVAALHSLAKSLGWHPLLKNVWVWADYGCIPQACPSTQSLAIRSLAAYASSATYFIVCAPPVPHTDTSDLCTLSTYQMRMWCRAEQVCHSMRNGTSKMYLATANASRGEMQVSKATNAVVAVGDDFFRESLRVFSGELTCCRLCHPNGQKCDRLSLVVPILGLYGELYRASLEHGAANATGGDKEEEGQSSSVAEFLSEIERHQEEIFPRTFRMITTRKGRRVEEEVLLFGDLIERMRARVKSGVDLTAEGREATASTSGMDSSQQGSMGDTRHSFIRHGGYIRHGSGEKRGNVRVETATMDPEGAAPISELPCVGVEPADLSEEKEDAAYSSFLQFVAPSKAAV